jgi:hypothetical protein
MDKQERRSNILRGGGYDDAMVDAVLDSSARDGFETRQTETLGRKREAPDDRISSPTGGEDGGKGDPSSLQSTARPLVEVPKDASCTAGAVRAELEEIEVSNIEKAHARGEIDYAARCWAWRCAPLRARARIDCDDALCIDLVPAMLDSAIAAVFGETEDRAQRAKPPDDRSDVSKLGSSAADELCAAIEAATAPVSIELPGRCLYALEPPDCDGKGAFGSIDFVRPRRPRLLYATDLASGSCVKEWIATIDDDSLPPKRRLAASACNADLLVRLRAAGQAIAADAGKIAAERMERARDAHSSRPSCKKQKCEGGSFLPLSAEGPSISRQQQLQPLQRAFEAPLHGSYRTALLHVCRGRERQVAEFLREWTSDARHSISACVICGGGAPPKQSRCVAWIGHDECIEAARRAAARGECCGHPIRIVVVDDEDDGETRGRRIESERRFRGDAWNVFDAAKSAISKSATNSTIAFGIAKERMAHRKIKGVSVVEELWLVLHEMRRRDVLSPPPRGGGAMSTYMREDFKEVSDEDDELLREAGFSRPGDSSSNYSSDFEPGKYLCLAGFSAEDYYVGGCGSARAATAAAAAVTAPTASALCAGYRCPDGCGGGGGGGAFDAAMSVAATDSPKLCDARGTGAIHLDIYKTQGEPAERFGSFAVVVAGTAGIMARAMDVARGRRDLARIVYEIAWIPDGAFRPRNKPPPPPSPPLRSCGSRTGSPLVSASPAASQAQQQQPAAASAVRKRSALVVICKTFGNAALIAAAMGFPAPCGEAQVRVLDAISAIVGECIVHNALWRVDTPTLHTTTVDDAFAAFAVADALLAKCGSANVPGSTVGFVAGMIGADSVRSQGRQGDPDGARSVTAASADVTPPLTRADVQSSAVVAVSKTVPDVCKLLSRVGIQVLQVLEQDDPETFGAPRHVVRGDRRNDLAADRTVFTGVDPPLGEHEQRVLRALWDVRISGGDPSAVSIPNARLIPGGPRDDGSGGSCSDADVAAWLDARGFSVPFDLPIAPLDPKQRQVVLWKSANREGTLFDIFPAEHRDLMLMRETNYGIKRSHPSLCAHPVSDPSGRPMDRVDRAAFEAISERVDMRRIYVVSATGRPDTDDILVTGDTFDIKAAIKAVDHTAAWSGNGGGGGGRGPKGWIVRAFGSSRVAEFVDELKRAAAQLFPNIHIEIDHR